MLRSIRAFAVDGRALCRRHRRRVSCLGARNTLILLKLLHRGGEFLLSLPFFGIVPCLLLLLCLEARNLLGIRGSRAHRQRALGRGTLVSTEQAGDVRYTYQRHDHNKRDHDRHTLAQGWFRLRLLGDGSGDVLVLVCHDYFTSALRWKSTRCLPMAR